MAKNTNMGQMGKQLHLRVIALFLIALVISLPISFAATISGIAFDGSIGAGPVVKQGDAVTISVNVTEDQGETLNVGTLHQLLKLGSATPFSGCVSTITSGKYTCTSTFSIPPSSNSFVYGPVDVTLYSDAGWTTPVDITSGSVTVDSELPIVNVGQIVQLGNKVEVTISATDTALPNGLSAVCSGFGSVELYWVTGQTTNSIPFSMQQTSGCSYTNTSRVDITGLPNGVRQLCARVTDRAGNSNQNCRSITIDNSVPTISAIDIVTASGSAQYIAPGYGTGVFVQFNTTYNNPTGFIVTVDGVQRGPVTCSGITCRAGPFLLQSAGSYAVSITGSSALGVIGAPVTKQVTVGLDDVAPVFTGISTNKTLNGKYYFKNGAAVVARFTESQSGLSGANAQLSIAGTLIGAPNNCTKTSASNWDCVWGAVNYAIGGQGNLSVVVSATDALGNVGTQGNATLYYDTLAPVVDLSTLNISVVGTSDLVSLASSRSFFKISFNVTDETTPITASVNMSAFDPRVNISTASCSTKNCSMMITTSQVGIGPYNDVGIITVSDALGNNVVFATPKIEVLKTSNETNTSYFRHSLVLTPSALEATTFPYINQKGYARVDVKTVSPSSSILKIDFKQCRNIPVVTVGNSTTSTTTSVFTTTSSAVGDTRLFKSNPQVTIVNQTQVLIAFTFKATELNQSNIQFLCDIDVAGRVEGNILVPKETETVLVNFSLYNLSVGELGANYDKKLQDQINKAKNHIGAKLEMFEKLFDLAKKFCNLWKLWVVVSTTMGIGGAVTKSASGPLYGTFFGIPAALGIDTTGSTICTTAGVVEAAGDGIFTTLFSGFCSFVNCEIGLANVASATYNKFADNGNPAKVATDLSGKTGGVANIISSGVASASGSTVAGNYAQAMVSAINPEDTLAGAIATLCIPGIIRALRRAQQIECQYALCLREDVPKGVPIEACDQSYEYSSCVYKTANFFILFAIWDAFINKIKSLISDPFALTGFVVGGYACYLACLPPGPQSTFTGPAAKVCLTARAIGKIGSLVQMIVGIKNDWTQKNYEAQDYCAQLE